MQKKYIIIIIADVSGRCWICEGKKSRQEDSEEMLYLQKVPKEER